MHKLSPLLQVVLYLTVLSPLHLFAQQQTVGLFLNSPEAYNGYTLFAPTNNTGTYLIDNCGELVHSWDSDFRPGLGIYLLENGNLLRTRDTDNPNFTAGGSGGGMELRSWEGDLLWQYSISSADFCQHHDVEPLPNGNILAIVWEAIDADLAAQAGRENPPAVLWSEKIVEIAPDLENGGGEIVWEWRVWDHLVQDLSDSLDNFGVVAESPQLININYRANNSRDWIHFNSVDYHPELDQIVLSSFNFGEIWIIDHSTSTEEAAGHTGGLYGRGGDLLYRWGNPQTYDQGSSADQQLRRQHDAHWIADSLADGGKIMIFNNQAGNQFSEVKIIDPPLQADGTYTYNGAAYGPLGEDWQYRASPPTLFYSANISGAQRLPNGNTLICEGNKGKLFEVNYDGQLVWQYECPVNGGGIIEQSGNPFGNSVFRTERFPIDYPAFSGRDLSPQGYIEPGSEFSCDLSTATEEPGTTGLQIFPNPARGFLQLSFTEIQPFSYRLLNQVGQPILQGQNQDRIDLQTVPAGLYWLEVRSLSTAARATRKVMVQ